MDRDRWCARGIPLCVVDRTPPRAHIPVSASTDHASRMGDADGIVPGPIGTDGVHEMGGYAEV